MEISGRTWYNVGRHYTCASSRPTNGRTITFVNCAHPPEASCWKNMGIISTDIIPVLIRRPTNGKTITLANYALRRRHHVGRTWYNIDRYYTSANSPSDQREDNYLGELCTSAGGIMLEEHGIISTDIIPVLIRRPTNGRTITLANYAHPPEASCWKNMV